MSTGIHDHGALAAYALDGLPTDDRRLLEDHLTGCPACRQELRELRETVAALDEVPAELFVDEPPEDADLLLQRTLHTVRREAAGRAWHRRLWATAAAAAVVVVALVGGVVLGRNQARDGLLVSPPPTGTTSASQPVDTRTGSHTDFATGARMTVTVVPAIGWVRVNAAVSGVPAGQRCRLWVVARDGSRQLAGSWLVSEQGAQDGTTLDGSALVPPANVVAVEVDNDKGQHLVSVPL